MFTKVVFLAIFALVYCQDHHQTVSISTAITHDDTKKEESIHYFEKEQQLNNVKTQHFFKPEPQIIQFALAPTAVPMVSEGPPAQAKYNLGDINNYFIRPQPAPKQPAPVYENVIDTAPPAPHRVHVQQVPLQRIVPLKTVQHVQALNQHVQAPVHHVQQVQQLLPVEIKQVELQHDPVYVPVQHVSVHNIPIYHEDQHISHHQESHGHQDYYAIPKYSFEYKVDDPHTHDSKYQHETRDGDVVKGVYSLLEPGGSVRTVEYSSDKKTGFNVNVKHTGVTKHVEPHHN